MHHILVPTDFNELGRAAFSLAVELSEKFNSKITLLHVLHLAKLAEIGMGLDEMELMAYSLKSRDSSSESEYSRIVERMKQAARNELESFGDPSWRKKVTVETALDEGRPSDKIVEFANVNDVDMIVMGTQGRGVVAKFFLGSVAENVIRTAECPVLTVRNGSHSEKENKNT